MNIDLCTSQTLSELDPFLRQSKVDVTESLFNQAPL